MYKRVNKILLTTVLLKVLETAVGHVPSEVSSKHASTAVLRAPASAGANSDSQWWQTVERMRSSSVYMFFTWQLCLL